MPISVQYVIFALIVIVPCLYAVFSIRKAPQKDGKPSWVQIERAKCESWIQIRVFNALVARGYYVKTELPCGPYLIDVALPQYKLAIECDGKEYHSTPEQKAHDRRKDRYLRKRGWKVLRFSGSMINRNIGKVIARIESEIKN